MANIISLQFSNTIELLQEKFDFNSNITLDDDIDYFIGTVQGTTTYTNLQSGGEATSNLGTTVFNRSGGSFNYNSVPTWTYNNYTILPTYITFRAAHNNNSSASNAVIQGLNAQGGWETLGSIPTSGFSPIQYQGVLSSTFFTNQYRIISSGGSNNGYGVGNIRMWGLAKRIDNGSMGLRPIPSEFATLNDVLTSFEDDTLITNQGAIYATEDKRQDVTSITLTGAYTIPSTIEYTVFVLDPSGATREVYLPVEPQLDHYVRIISSNGAFNLTIKEASGQPTIVELGNGSGILTAEFIWEHSDQTWHATF